MRRWLHRLLGIFRRRRLDGELDEEVRSHLGMLEDRYRRAGMSSEEARLAARRQFGGLAQLKEAHRSERAIAWIEHLLGDVSYAARGLVRNPGFALTAILSIALAVGANSAIFSYADGLLLRPLPVPDPSGVVSLRLVSPGLSSQLLLGSGQMSYPDFEDFREQMQSFDGMVLYDDFGVGFGREADGAQLRVNCYLVSGNFFDVLGIPPAIGRGFGPDEDRVPGRDPVLVLGHDFWTSQLGGDPSVVGSSVRVNGLEFTVIGVAQESSGGLDQFIRPDFFVPVTMGPALFARSSVSGADRLLEDRGLRTFRVKGRLKPGISRGEAAREAGLVAASLAEAHPATNRDLTATVDTEVGMRLVMYPLLGVLVSALFIVVVVNLLVACANVANLLLARGRARAREIGVRLAIGASRARLVRLLLIESLLIAGSSGALALFVAELAVGIFSTIRTGDVVQLTFRMDGRVVWFTLAVSLTSAVIFGLVPALRSTRADLVSTLKIGGLSGQQGRRFLGRNALVILQIAGSMLLLAGAMGFRVLFYDALASQPGFERERRITMRFDPALAGYDPDRIQRFYRDVVDRSVELPGIRSAALTSTVPLTWFDIGIQSVIPEGYELPPDSESVDVFAYVVDEHYFDTFGVPLLAGRGFTAADTADAPKVAVVNEAFADAYLGGDPLGRRIRLDAPDGPLVEVVGVTATGKHLSVIEPPVQAIHLPLDQNPRSRMTLIARTEGDPSAMAGPLREMVKRIHPDVPVFMVQTMADVFESNSVSMLRVVSATYDSASLMALVLALVGLYAVLSFQVAGRTREIGIRMALGAGRIQVMSMFLGRAAAMAGIGVAMGVFMSFLAGWAAEASLGSPPANPAALVLVVALMLLTSLVAAAVPARRASRVDPQQALREE